MHLYDREVWSVYGFIGYRLTSRVDVEDLTQQTFEKALRAWENLIPAAVRQGFGCWRSPAICSSIITVDGQSGGRNISKNVMSCPG